MWDNNNNDHLYLYGTINTSCRSKCFNSFTGKTQHNISCSSVVLEREKHKTTCLVVQWRWYKKVNLGAYRRVDTQV